MKRGVKACDLGQVRIVTGNGLNQRHLPGNVQGRKRDKFLKLFLQSLIDLLGRRVMRATMDNTMSSGLRPGQAGVVQSVKHSRNACGCVRQVGLAVLQKVVLRIADPQLRLWTKIFYCASSQPSLSSFRNSEQRKLQ